MRHLITFACATNFAKQARLEHRVREAEKRLVDRRYMPSHQAPVRVRVRDLWDYGYLREDFGPEGRAYVKRLYRRKVRHTYA